ncbi:hypothetical protein [Calditerricola satsumensis]|uniref:hypothetical protein n=1 Tax=Calditerricola satsumensis TaxID=373054 RepID=UPI0006D28FAE|nr:hypothetical protein [Calditerricola satsumensis]
MDERKVRAVARKIEAALNDFCFAECQLRICDGCPVDAALQYACELSSARRYESHADICRYYRAVESQPGSAEMSMPRRVSGAFLFGENYYRIV